MHYLAATTTLAQDVACLVDNQQVAVVDLDTGVCPFTIPASLAAFFTFVSLEEYNVQFYYTIVNNVRYNTDIRNAGKVINVPLVIYMVLVPFHFSKFI